MSLRLRCTICGDQASFLSRPGALADGWILMEILTKDRTKYNVLCPRHRGLEWIKRALDEDPKGGKP